MAVPTSILAGYFDHSLDENTADGSMKKTQLEAAMSRDAILKDDAGVRYSYDNIKTQGWLDGHACGTEDAANYLRQRSVELFKQGRHEQAINMQKLGEELLTVLKPLQEKKANEHKDNYPEEIKEE